MTTGDPAQSVQVDALDTVGTNLGNDTLCGLRTFQILPTTFPLISIDPATGLLSIENLDSALEDSEATFTVTAVLNDYPLVGASEDFLVKFDPVPVLLGNYMRDESLPSTIQVFQGDFPTTFVVPNIYPAVSLDSEMDIDLRQADGGQLSFVATEELVGETIVTISASQLIAQADYELRLESFDKMSPD